MKILLLIATVASFALGSLAAVACDKKSTNSSQVETGTKVLKPKA
jgi:hypothetical protein